MIYTQAAVYISDCRGQRFDFFSLCRLFMTFITSVMTKKENALMVAKRGETLQSGKAAERPPNV